MLLAFIPAFDVTAGACWPRALREASSGLVKIGPAPRPMLRRAAYCRIGVFAALLHRIPRHVLKQLRLFARLDTVLSWYDDLVAHRHVEATCSRGGRCRVPDQRAPAAQRGRKVRSPERAASRPSSASPSSDAGQSAAAGP